MAWCGWQWDVQRRPGVLGLAAPQAIDGDRPIEGTVRVEFRSDRLDPDHGVGEAFDQLDHDRYSTGCGSASAAAGTD